MAVVSHATLPDERTVIGDLSTIADLVDEAALPTPALVIVGDVVARRVAPSAPQEATTSELRGRSRGLRAG